MEGEELPWGGVGGELSSSEWLRLNNVQFGSSSSTSIVAKRLTSLRRVVKIGRGLCTPKAFLASSTCHLVVVLRELKVAWNTRKWRGKALVGVFGRFPSSDSSPSISEANVELSTDSLLPNTGGVR